MSNQFYSLLVKFIQDYFMNQSFEGSRYYFDTENQSNLEDFIEACKNSPFNNSFQVINEVDDVVYETVSLDFEGRRLIIAPAIDGVTNDFLVMLRNKVSEQAEGFEKTGILFATATRLDSISGGSMNIVSKNQALSADKFNNYFNEALKSQQFTKIQQSLIRNYFTSQARDVLSNYSIFENKTVLGIIEKGSMSPEDYKELGYFYVQNDEGLKDKAIRKFVSDNAKLYSKLNEAREYHNLDNVTSTLFLENDQSKVKRLIEEKESWESLPFNRIAEMMEKCKLLSKSNLVVKDDLVCVKNANCYIKTKSESGSGSREYYIIAECQDEAELKITYESNLMKNSVRLKRNNTNITYEIKKNELSIKMNSTNGFEAEKVEYFHDGKTSNLYKFNILVLPVGVKLSTFQQIKSQYKLNVEKSATKLHLEDMGDVLLFDEALNDDISLRGSGERVDIRTLRSIDYSMVSTDGNIEFKLQYYTSEISVIIEGMDRKIAPITKTNLFNLPRLQKQSFEVIDKDATFQQVTIGTSNYNVANADRKYLRIEKEYVENAYLHTKNHTLDVVELGIDKNINALYLQFLQIFQMRETIPSLAYWDEEIVECAEEYLNSIIEYFKNIEEDASIDNKFTSLLLLGVHKEGNEVYLTPFHPINVAYQLQLLDELKEESVSNEILKRFSTSGLLPFAVFDVNFAVDRHSEYLTSDDMNLLLWRKYCEKNEVSIGNTSQYVAKIVEDKLNQFKKHFGSLFQLNEEYPLRISATNITSDLELFKGIVMFMLSELKKTNLMPNVELDIFQFTDIESKFEVFSYLNNVDEFQMKFGIDDKALENDNYDSKDLLRLLQTRLNYTKHILVNNHDKVEVDFYHLSFYKMHNTGKTVVNDVYEQPTAMGLNGIINGVSAVETEENYKVGYGSQFVNEQNSIIYQVANCWNTLNAMVHHGGTAIPYAKDQTLIHNIVLEDFEIWAEFAKKSIWVCFIEPEVDFNYFMKKDSIEVIHYNDQYSSSSKIDAITITNQVKSYHKLLSGFLNQNEQVIKTVIKSFNVLNGEWLLKIFDEASKNENTVREKLSVVAASKVHKLILEQRNQNIFWIPISLEEIVRVSGAVGLSKLEVFSTKSLNHSGSLSDDLLFIGIEKTDEKTKIHLHGCEVKVGHTDAYLSKAKTQIKSLCNLLHKHLIEESGSFKARYLSHFFYDLALSNYEKQLAYNVERYDQINDVKIDVINGNVELALYEIQGSVICFNSNELNTVRTLEKMDDLHSTIFNYKYFENDVISIVSQNTEQLNASLNNVFDFSVFSRDIVLVPFHQDEVIEEIDIDNISLSDIYNDAVEEEAEEETNETEEVALDVESPESVIVNHGEEDNTIVEIFHEPEEISNGVDESKPALMELGLSDHKPPRTMNWAYLSSEINNRHVFAIGKSGSGKTYFIQKMLKELSKQNISSFIIDYSSSFRMDMLDATFKTDVKINYRLIRQVKCPINPFKKYWLSIDGFEFIESSQDVANRVKHIFSAVYRDLGAVQLNSIYEAVVEGLSIYGESFSFHHLGEKLRESNPSVLGQIQTFIDSDVFANEAIEWGSVFGNTGEVTIFQLAPYDRMTQKIITEFVLWDFWYYASSKGKESHPMPVILDESQNLDWSEKGPAYKMLTEGRKFGVCSWYATQSFAQLGKFGSTIIENAATKVYFAVSDSEISDVAKKISKTEYRYYEMKLKELLKGQAIVDTLFEDKDKNQKDIRFVKITKI